jgi:hypothetical protein
MRQVTHQVAHQPIRLLGFRWEKGTSLDASAAAIWQSLVDNLDFATRFAYLRINS